MDDEDSSIHGLTSEEESYDSEEENSEDFENEEPLKLHQMPNDVIMEIMTNINLDKASLNALCRTNVRLRIFCKTHEEQIKRIREEKYKTEIEKKFKVYELYSIFDTYEDQYDYLHKYAIMDLGTLPILTTKNVRTIEMQIANSPAGTMEHAKFIRYQDQNRYSTQITMVAEDTIFYVLSGYKDKRYYSDQFRNGLTDMIKFLLERGYTAIIGFIDYGKMIFTMDYPGNRSIGKKYRKLIDSLKP